MSAPLEVGALAGRLVRLEPLGAVHVDALLEAGGERRESYGFTLVPGDEHAMRAYVADLLAARVAGEEIPFVQVRRVDGRPVGVTRFLNLRRRPGEAIPYAVEIGGTWLAGSAQRAGINLEAKLLLLSHAFGRWEVGRVDLKTDARNERSRNAIAGLGARFEGALANWQPSQVASEESELRDTAMYAITDRDWPALREALAARLR